MIEKSSAFDVMCSTQAVAACPAQGFLGDPGCGVEGDFVHCQPGVVGLSCVEGAKSKHTQGCR
jgi:hypothetical protein